MPDKNKKNITKDKSVLIDQPTEKPKDYATNMTNFEKDTKNFHYMSHLEPHDIRRQKILAAHPEVTQLLEKDPISLYFSLLLNCMQLGMCFIFKYYITSWWVTLTLAYFVSAILNHGLFVLMHDITHFTCFKNVTYNQLTGILTNLPQVIPSAISFGRYHRDHHTYLGDADDDPDIPQQWEIRVFSNKFLKLFFLFVMPIFYAIRPFLKKPKPANKMEVLNIIVCIVYDIFVYRYFGGQALIYLLLGTLFGLSINPVGIHVIAEHYEFNKSQDTYSYYGWINWINFNMGYHVEHHDFPNISWYKLPILRKIAPEYYDNLPQIESYFKVYWLYIMDNSIGPWARIARIPDEKTK